MGLRDAMGAEVNLTHHMGKADAYQGLYFLGPYVRDQSGKWRRATFAEMLKKHYTPDFIARVAWGPAARVRL